MDNPYQNQHLQQQQSHATIDMLAVYGSAKEFSGKQIGMDTLLGVVYVGCCADTFNKAISISTSNKLPQLDSRSCPAKNKL